MSSQILSTISSVSLPPNTNTFSLRFSKCLNELLPTPKVTTFLSNSWPKLHEQAPSNNIPKPY